MYDIQRKFIFTHPPKCAGTTLEVMLGYAPETAEFTPEQKHQSLTEAINAVEAMGFLHTEFLKVSCVRNPWDRMVSWYFHIKSSVPFTHFKQNPEKPLPPWIEQVLQLDFDSFIDREYQKAKQGALNPYSGWETRRYFYHQGEFAVDFVVRFESLEKDIKSLFTRLCMPQPPMAFRRQRTSRPLGDDYRIHYKKEETIEKVAFLGADAIKLFGYRFEG